MIKINSIIFFLFLIINFMIYYIMAKHGPSQKGMGHGCIVNCKSK